MLLSFEDYKQELSKGGLTLTCFFFLLPAIEREVS